MRRQLLIALAGAIVCQTAGAQSLDPAKAQRIDSVFARYATGHTPGCAVAVTDHGRIAYARGYGMASLELGVPITPRTVFDLGSVSKQFTAASVLLLAIDGKLLLDDDVRRYLPELPDLGATVTLRHLLTHTSGWRDYNDLLNIEGFDTRDRTTDRDAWATLVRQRALNFAPGSSYRYSNTGFFFLGEVVKRVSGKSLASFAKERIFVPLGMSHTFFLDDTRRVIEGRAIAYSPSDSGFNVDMSNWDQVGDGAVQSTVEDLARWEANFENPSVGGRKLVELLTERGRLTGGDTISYSAGLVVAPYRGVARVSHSGAWAGYRAHLARFPEQHVGVLLTCNRGDVNTEALSSAVAAVLVDYTPPRPVVAARSAQYGGFYTSSTTGASLQLAMHGDTLVSGASRQPLVSLGNGAFTDRIGAARLDLGAGRLIRTPVEGVADTLTRVSPVAWNDLPPERQAEYVGTYISPEVAMPYEVVARGGRLFVRLTHGDDVALNPVYADAFDSDLLPRIVFARNSEGRVSALTFVNRGIAGLRLGKR